MSERKLNYDLEKVYSHEFNNIRNRLNQLEEGRVYELSHVKMDGYLSTQIVKLRKDLTELFNKIQNGEEGFAEKVAKIKK